LLAESINLVLKTDDFLIGLDLFLPLQKIDILLLLSDLVSNIRLQFSSPDLVVGSLSDSISLQDVLLLELSLHVLE
jgi:hypothetical protein